MNGNQVVFDIGNAAPDMGGPIIVFVMAVPMWCFSFLIWLRFRPHLSYRLIGNIYLALMTVAVVATCITSIVSYRGEISDWRDLTQLAQNGEWQHTRGMARLSSDKEIARKRNLPDPYEVLTVGDRQFEVGLYSKNYRVANELIRKVDGEPVILYFHEHHILRIERDADDVDHE